jgi:peptidoglycan/LPS O-acetylase OafA/YrhL
MTVWMAVFTTAFAAISYYALERPVLRLKNRPANTWFRFRSRSATR